MQTQPATTQITVRLPTELVEWLDQYVDESHPSRTALITQALWRAKRRKEAVSAQVPAPPPPLGAGFGVWAPNYVGAESMRVALSWGTDG